MDGGIGSDRPFADYLLERHLAFRVLLNLGRVRDVVIFLEGLWQKAPEFGRLLRVVLVADHDKLLDQNRHIGGILTGVSGAAFPFRFVLLPGAGIGNEPVAMLAGQPHRFPAVCGGQKRNRLRRRVVELGVDIVVFAAMRDLPAIP